MGREVKSLEKALEVLQALEIALMTTNKIENNLWIKGVQFFLTVVIVVSLTTMQFKTCFQLTAR